MKIQVYRKLRKELLITLRLYREHHEYNSRTVIRQLQKVLYQLRALYYTFEGKKFVSGKQVMKKHTTSTSLEETIARITSKEGSVLLDSACKGYTW